MNKLNSWFIQKYKNPVWKIVGAISLVVIGVLGSYLLTPIREKRKRALLIDFDTSKELTGLSRAGWNAYENIGGWKRRTKAGAISVRCAVHR